MASLPHTFPRHAAGHVETALADTRVVVIMGARQVGKSTLMQTVTTKQGGWQSVTLDDEATRRAAAADPAGFLAGLQGPVAIDEVQRVPDLLLAIKQRVDRDQRPGQFLLSGSANILTAPKIADALTGRAEYVRLTPLTQAEMLGRSPAVMEQLLAGRVPYLEGQAVGRAAYASAITAGGYPAAVALQPSRLTRFFDSYVDTVLDRDLRSLADLHDTAGVRGLLRAVAATSSGLLNFSSLSRDLGTSDQSLRSYFGLLETLFLVRRLPAWSSNLLARETKTPKAFVADTGLLMALIGGTAARVESDLDLGGSLFETFAVIESLRLCEALEVRPGAFHLRDRDGREVDLVLERRDGGVVGIEVKAAGSVGPRDFRGLRYLRDRLGERFVAGIALYAGESTVPFGDRLSALPISALWGGGPPYDA